MSAPQPRGASGVTYTHAAEGYFDKRGLTRAAGFWGLWGLGVAAVISGDFSGWNFGIGGAGWGGFLIATVIVTLMYVGMIGSIGEMSAAMPHTGGAYSFARSAMGPWGGFVTGLAEKYTITAVVKTYSMVSANPVTNPPHGPIAARANEYAPPVCGKAGDISARLKIRPRYMMAIMMAAMNRPPQPPAPMPKFQPEKWPEMTAPTPRAHSDHTRA